ncbi:MAG: Glycosyl transferase family 2 [Microgenomates bacterium OLB23]|nr:MAG: Glycosyl transferase family 2 [Microgenomates bacterium OLB23]
MKDYSTPYVSIVIITYDPTAGHLQKTLKTLQRQSYHNFEIIIVDSGVNKSSSEVLYATLGTTAIPP